MHLDDIDIYYLRDEEMPQVGDLLARAFPPEKQAVVAVGSDPPIPDDVSYLVADHDDAIVGVAEYIVGPKAVWLLRVAVEPDYRRQGIARRLIDVVHEWVALEEDLELRLTTVIERGHFTFLEKVGFHVDAERMSKQWVNRQGEPAFELEMERLIQFGSPILQWSIYRGVPATILLLIAWLVPWPDIPVLRWLPEAFLGAGLFFVFGSYSEAGQTRWGVSLVILGGLFCALFAVQIGLTTPLGIALLLIGGGVAAGGWWHKVQWDRARKRRWREAAEEGEGAAGV